jgi:hypothetical protein
MASMTREQRAADYLRRLLNAKDVKRELDLIIIELNSLVFTNTREKLSKEDRLKIIEELERQARRRRAIDENVGFERYVEKSVTASDNSDILDVISAMKRRVGE